MERTRKAAFVPKVLSSSSSSSLSPSYLEDVVRVHETKARVGGLEVVQSLAHVTVSGEDDGLEALVRLGDALGLADVEEPLEDVLVGEPGEANDGAAALYGLDDLRAQVASQGEPGGV